MKRRRFRSAFLLFAVFLALSARLPAETSAPARNDLDKRSVFIGIVQDSLGTIAATYRGDSETSLAALFKAAYEGLSKWAAKDESRAEFLKPLLEPPPSGPTDFLKRASELPDSPDFPWLAAADAAVDAAVRSLGDPFSHYFTLTEFRRLMGMLSKGMKDYYGLIPSRALDGSLYIAHIKFGSPAYYAALRTHDVITAVNGRKVEDIPRDELAKMFAPDAPAPLSLTVTRKDWPEPVTYRLEPMDRRIPMVLSRMLPDGVGYVRATIFGKGMAGMVRGALDDLSRRGAWRFILDLRNNPGGSANEALGLCDTFLSGRKVVTIFKMFRGLMDTASPLLTKGEESPYEGVPLVCLVNHSSASASEMSSGALQDHHRATIIGTQTFGKGCAQVPFGVPASRGRRFLYLTVSKYFLPSGRTIHKKGVTPDIIVKDIDPASDTWQFAVLENWSGTRRFVKRELARSPGSVREVVEDKRPVTALRSWRRLLARARDAFEGLDEHVLEVAARTALVSAWCSATRSMPPCDPADAVMKAAMERLRFECGDLSR